jgi:hypothetical protein
MLLCVIVRQTCGWQEGKTRKGTDWLTHQQLKARTGLASASICSAIDTLMKRGFIEVCDNSGMPLKTSAERRRAGRLHFSLCHPQGFQKAKTTKEREYINTFVDFKNEKAPEASISESEILSAVVGDEIFIAVWETYRYGYRTLMGIEGLPDIHSTDLNRFRTIIDDLGKERVIELLNEFFSSDYSFIVRQKYSLSAFAHSVNLLQRSKQIGSVPWGLTNSKKSVGVRTGHDQAQERTLRQEWQFP